MLFFLSQTKLRKDRKDRAAVVSSAFPNFTWGTATAAASLPQPVVCDKRQAAWCRAELSELGARCPGFLSQGEVAVSKKMGRHDHLVWVRPALFHVLSNAFVTKPLRLGYCFPHFVDKKTDGKEVSFPHVPKITRLAISTSGIQTKSLCFQRPGGFCPFAMLPLTRKFL